VQRKQRSRSVASSDTVACRPSSATPRTGLPSPPHHLQPTATAFDAASSDRQVRAGPALTACAR
jgi:hypothetical protein